MSASSLNQLSDSNPAGTCLGQDTSDLVSFHGVSTCDQSATASALATTAAISVAGSACFGFSTSDQANAIATTVNLIRTCLREKGLMA
jgi:hypothetical protein